MFLILKNFQTCEIPDRNFRDPLFLLPTPVFRLITATVHIILHISEVGRHELRTKT